MMQGGAFECAGERERERETGEERRERERETGEERREKRDDRHRPTNQKQQKPKKQTHLIAIRISDASFCPYLSRRSFPVTASINTFLAGPIAAQVIVPGATSVLPASCISYVGKPAARAAVQYFISSA